MFLAKIPYVIPHIFQRQIWKMPGDEKAIYLTFDDGPIPEVTPEILDILNNYNAKASFFCLGKNAEKNPGILAEIISRGHSVGNHTFSHLNGRKHRGKEYIDDIQKCSGIIPGNLFRPPYGRITNHQRRIIAREYRIIMWTILSGDFDIRMSPERCLENSIKHTDSGSIIVFHDSIKAYPRVKYALPRFLEYFNERGYSFKNIPQSRAVMYKGLSFNEFPAAQASSLTGNNDIHA